MTATDIDGSEGSPALSLTASHLRVTVRIRDQHSMRQAVVSVAHESMMCDLCTRWVAEQCSLDSQVDELAAWLASLTQGVHEREALVQDINLMMQQQTATQAQSNGTPVPENDLHREMLARVEEFDRAEVESDQLEERETMTFNLRSCR